jgi:hypothetical protein
MSYHPGRDMIKARNNAQANADYFNVPFVIFTDTSGNIRIEKLCTGPKNIDVYVVYPSSNRPSQEHL